MNINSPYTRGLALKQARTIVDRAISEKRELSAAEDAEVAGLSADVEAYDASLKAKPKGLLDRFPKVAGPGLYADPWDDGGGATLFTAEAKDGLVRAVKTRTAFRTEVDAKAALGVTTLLPPSGIAVQPGIQPGAAFPLSSLFAQQAADGPLVRYYRLTAGQAAVVAELGEKPDAGVAVTPVDLPLVKIAARAVISDEMAADAPFMVSAISTELQVACAAAENSSILATFAATSGILTGSGTTDDVLDVLAAAIGAQESYSGRTPSAVVVNPATLAAIRTGKASTSGIYTIDPTSPGPATIHGVPVVSTPATAAGTAWVIESSGVVIYRRGPMTVEVGRDGTDFSHNTATVIAEERFGTAVMRPSSLTKITLT